VVPKGLKNCKFVGHDMGDTILAEFLTRRHRSLLPSELSNIVGEVIFTNGGMVFSQINARILQTFLSYEIAGPIMRTLQKSNFFMSQIQPRLFRKTIRKIFSNRFQAKNPDAIESYINDLLAFNSGSDSYEKMQYFRDRSVLEYRWHDALKAFDLPVTLLWGDNDDVAPLRISHALQELNPNFKLEVMQNVGHFWMIEMPYMKLKNFFE